MTEKRTFSLSEALSRTTVANVASAIIALSGTFIAAYYGKWELFGALVGAAGTYLFRTRNGNTNGD